MDLSGKRFLVTGASGGIGRATAIFLAALNAELIITGRNEKRLHETLANLNGRQHTMSPTDLLLTPDLESWLKSIVSTTGRLDGLVHCAGVSETKPLTSTSESDIEQMFALNVHAAFRLCRGFKQRWCRAQAGSIVLIGSILGLVGAPGASVYAATKAALLGLTKSLALEFARQNIRVNCIAPGYVRTEMYTRLEQTLTPEQSNALAIAHPLGLGEPRDVASAVAFLLADTGRWITGSTLVIDGGYSAQ